MDTRSRRWPILTALLVALPLLLTGAGCKSPPSAQELAYLFERTEREGSTQSTLDEAYIRGISATANLRLLGDDERERFLVPMPDGKDIVIARRRVDHDPAASHWFGEVEGARQSFVFLTWTPRAISGSIAIGEDLYRILATGKGLYQIAQLDPDRMTERDDDGEVPKYDSKGGGGKGDADGCPDPASDIDLMVVYTQAAEDGAGGADGMEALIYQCMELTNLCYENSDITQRVHLVHFEKVSYTEAGDSVVDRLALKDPSDGEIDGVHALRDSHGADIVVMIVETAESGNCGRAYIMDPVSAAHDAWAFGVIKRSCALDNKSFPHEVGHIMSARHQDDAAITPYAYGHGYQVLSPADSATAAWRTIMSKVGGTIRVPWFSNPDIQYPPSGAIATDAMGTAADEDNARVLDNTAATVANFRCSSPGVNNVWMKDTWEDTGLEPDPATAGESMWRSPYIWVRNAQDPTMLSAHLHENPEFGSTNWIYVKLHNGSASAQSGTLELHIADASISLTWPTGWTLVGSVPATLAGSGTTVLEREWTSVPAPTPSSHYCMVARWVSATDPMHTAEGASIGTNVRENNNIVWRNLNVVDLTSDDDGDVAFGVAGGKGQRLSRIVFADVTPFPKPSFLATGRAIITCDQPLLEFWAKGGGHSTGLHPVGDGSFEMKGATASLDNLLLPVSYRGVIRVRFVKGDATPHGKFAFSVAHHVAEGSKSGALGGVDFELVNMH
jgi:hypothetical protein